MSAYLVTCEQEYIAGVDGRSLAPTAHVLPLHTVMACTAAYGAFIPHIGRMTHAWVGGTKPGLFDMDR